jgi:hypothetical protein
MGTVAMAKEEIKSEAIKVRITPSLRAALEKLADAEERSLSSYIERLLKAHVSRHG